MNSHKIIKTSITLAFFIVISVFCSVSNEEKQSNDSKMKVGLTIRNGKSLFTHYCVPCHGEDGDGEGNYYGYELNPKPANFTEKDFFRKRPLSDIKNIIKKGSKSIGKSNLCPPWGGNLYEEEISSIAKFMIYSFDDDTTISR